MVDQPITEPAGDLLLQPLNLGTPELDDGAGFQVNQVIMMLLRRSLVPGMAIAEFMPLTHYVRIVRAIMLKGATLTDLRIEAAALVGLTLLAMFIAVTRFRRTLD